MSIIVISVGTSLLSNNSEMAGQKTLEEKFNSRGTISVQDIQYLSFNFDSKGVLENTNKDNSIDSILKFSKEFFRCYMNEEAIKRHIGYRKNGEKDNLPAEISSLYLYYYDAEGELRRESNEKDEVFLLTTDTPDAVYCARMIRELIKKVSLFNKPCSIAEDIEIIAGLDVYNPGVWSDRGLDKLYSFFKEAATLYENSERILIRTGGYKEFSADLKILAMEFGFKSYYLFGRSTELLIVEVLNWPRNFGAIASNTKLIA